MAAFLGLVSLAAPVDREMATYQNLAFEVLRRAVDDVRKWAKRNRRNTEAWISPDDRDAAAFLYGGVVGPARHQGEAVTPLVYEEPREGIELWLQLAGVDQAKWDDAVYVAVGNAPRQMLGLPVYDPGVSARTLRRRRVA